MNSFRLWLIVIAFCSLLYSRIVYIVYQKRDGLTMLLAVLSDVASLLAILCLTLDWFGLLA